MGEADYAVLPIENSTAGIVSDIYDLLVEYPHYIVGEQELPVEHVLMALPGAKVEEIRTVISHPQALAQCRRFLDSNENWKTEERLNTAAAAKEVSESGDLTMAAVGSPYAAEHFGLQILKEGIFDARGNTTRFVIYFRSETLCKGCTENQRMHGTAASKRFSLQCTGTFYLQRSEHDQKSSPARFRSGNGSTVSSWISRGT